MEARKPEKRNGKSVWVKQLCEAGPGMLAGEDTDREGAQASVFKMASKSYATLPAWRKCRPNHTTKDFHGAATKH